MANIGPLAQGGLDEGFRLAVGAGSVRTGEAVLNAEFEAGSAEVAGAIARTVVGEQVANENAVAGVEGDGGLSLLVGQHGGEGEAGVIVDGDVQGLPAVELRAAAVDRRREGRRAGSGSSFDVKMEEIAGSGVLITQDGRGGMEMAPAVEPGALQDAADGGGTEGDSGGSGLRSVRFDLPRIGWWLEAQPCV